MRRVRSPLSRVRVSVPASSANLGPGYDCLGVALPLRLVVTVERSQQPLVVEISGDGHDSLPCDERNLIVSTLLDTLQCASHGLTVTVHNEVPLSSGAGSSSAAIVAAIAAGLALRDGVAPTRAEVLRRATAIEGHPDNVAAAIEGGFTLAVDGDPPLARRIEPPDGLTLLLVVPKAQLATTESRAVLRPSVDRADAVHNLQRVALLVHALQTGDLDALPRALTDRLHQPDRLPLVPLYEALADAPLEALGVTLSGAGPSVLVWARSDQAPGVAARVSQYSEDAQIHILAVDSLGLEVLFLEHPPAEG